MRGTDPESLNDLADDLPAHMLVFIPFFPSFFEERREERAIVHPLASGYITVQSNSMLHKVGEDRERDRANPVCLDERMGVRSEEVVHGDLAEIA